MAVAIGLVPHTGWAWLVRVSGPRGAPTIESRERIVACEVVDGELYHLAAERPRDAAAFLEARRATAVTQAGRVLEPHLASARKAVVVGKQAPLEPLDRILASHPLIHGAEGELWRAIFAEACAARGLAADRSASEDLHAALGKRHGKPAIDAFLADGKRAVGSPWSREPQDAALAAWSAL